MTGYILITPAHNEEAFIGKTLESVVNQTTPPLRWVIVDDASTDDTARIVEEYAARHPMIHLVRRERDQGRHFGNKAHAFAQGYEMVQALASEEGLSYDFIGNLDADIELPREYFATLLEAFAAQPRLGITGGMVHSLTDGEFRSQNVARDSVAGAVQLFRRACFEDVGGYLPLPMGGIDSAAEILARMHGWEVRTQDRLRVMEHRRTGTAVSRPLAARFKEGRRFHSLGYSLPFFMVRFVRRLADRPRIIGSCTALAGFLSARMRREPVALPPEAVDFLRREQSEKLRKLFAWPGTRGKRAEIAG